jgi:hypothetical protein
VKYVTSLLSIEAEGETFCAAAGFYEFVERRRDGRISSRGKIGVQTIAACVCNHMLADDDCVAGESFRFLTFNFNKRFRLAAVFGD